MKTISDKLRELAGWIEEGREIEFRDGNSREWKEFNIASNFIACTGREIRVKPVKPRILYAATDGVFKFYTTTKDAEDMVACFYESTPEVREALKAAGIEI